MTAETAGTTGQAPPATEMQPADAAAGTSSSRKAGWLGLLADRDFRWLWTGETVSFLGSAVSTVALPLVAVTRLHASPLAVTSLAAVTWLPWLVIGLPAGAWVDRLPRRAVMVTADVVSLLALASVPIAAAIGVLSMTLLIIAATVAGMARVFFQTAYRAWLPTLVRAEDLVEANAKVQGSEQVAGLAGPGLAGSIAQVLSAVGGVVLDAASFAVSAFCLLRIRQPKAPRTDPEANQDNGERSLRADIRQGALIVARDGLLRANALYGCLANFAIIGYESLLVPFLIDEVRFTPGMTGLLISAISIGGLIGAFAARRMALRFGSARAVLIGKVALPPLGLLIPLAGHGAGAVAFVGGNLAVTTGVVAGNIVFSGFVQGYVPSGYLGRVSSCTQVVNFCAIPLGALIAGGIASATSIRTALWVMTALLAAAGAVLVASPLRRLRNLPTAQLSGP